MNILYINPAANLGGAERSLIDLITAIRGRIPTLRAQVLLLADGPLVEKLEKLSIPVKVAPMPAALARLGEGALMRQLNQLTSRSPLALIAPLTKYMAGLRRLARAEEFDVIHSNGFKSHMLTGLLANRSTPIVCHVRDFVSTRRVMSRMFATVIPARAWLIANSKAVAADVRSIASNPGRVVTVYNGIDTDQFSPHAEAEESEPSTRVRIGLVATYARWKGQDTFIRAMAALPLNVRSKASFSIIGGAIYQTEGSQWSLEELRAIATRAGVGDEVSFVPFQDNNASIYRGLDVLVHASTTPEPFGRTIVEGMASELAVIATDAGGASELFDANRHALSVAPGDVSGLANAMKILINDQDFRLRLGKAGRQHAVENFGLGQLGCNMAEFYQKIIRENE